MALDSLDLTLIIIGQTITHIAVLQPFVNQVKYDL